MRNNVLKTIGIVISHRNNKAFEIGRELINLLLKSDIGLTVYPRSLEKEYKSVNKITFVNSIKDVRGDIVITVGGDGTVLRTFLYIKDKDTPIMGIGLGERNFLSSVSIDKYKINLEKLLEGKFHIRDEMRLKVEIEGLTYNLPPVLNEVLFATSTPGKTVEAYVGIKSEKKREFEILWGCKADGVLVSTPIGSTAYAFAAGGPVVDTDLEALLVVPLLPVDRKPIYLLDPKSEVYIWASERRSKPMLVLDGQITIELDWNQIVKVSKSDIPAHLITFDRDINIMRLKKAAKNV